MTRPNRAPLIGAIIAILLGLAAVLTAITDPFDGGGTTTRTVTVATPGAVAPAPLVTTVDTNGAKAGVQTGTVAAPATATARVAATALGDHADARDETPVGVSPQALEAGRQAQERLAETDQLPLVTPDAAPQQRGCTTALVKNYSTRRGVRPRLFVLHYTVSPNRPGVGDVNAVVNLFNTPSFAASSNYVLDREAHCKYIVRESDKAWTQAAANSFAISVEIINSGHEGTLISGAGLRKLGVIVSDATRRWKIPLRRGAVSGCVPTRPGIVTHQMLGACGGGHVDVSPYNALGTVINAALAARRAGQVTSVDRRTCARLNAWRRAGRPHSALATNQRRRDALAHRHVTCTPSGPRRG
jgi:hypothetical protein